jgi:hypothetical protein
MVKADQPVPEPLHVVVDPALPRDQRTQLLHLNPWDSPTHTSPARLLSWNGEIVTAKLRRIWLPRTSLAAAAGVGAFMVGHGSANPADLWRTPPGGLAAVLAWGHNVLLVACLLVAGIALLTVIKSMAAGVAVGESSRQRKLRLAHGRYVALGDLDMPARALLGRAQKAVSLVLGSTVHQAGLLDSVQNEVVLPDQEWELARALRNLSQMRARDPELASATPSASAAREAFAAACDQVEKRVEALERYADQVQAADVTYGASDPGGDRHALTELEDLSSHAQDVEQALRDSVQQAREIGHLLPPAGRLTDKA